jgi:hypothetical protein
LGLPAVETFLDILAIESLLPIVIWSKILPMVSACSLLEPRSIGMENADQNFALVKFWWK